MDLRQASSQLVLAFEGTKEFKDLKMAIREIEKIPQYKKILDDLRLLQKKLYEEELSEQEANQIMSEMSGKFEKLQNIPEFSKYFEVSNNFDNLFSYVTTDISRNLNVSLSGS